MTDTTILSRNIYNFNVSIFISQLEVSWSYRHGQPNKDSQSTMRVRIRLPMSVYEKICNKTKKNFSSTTQIFTCNTQWEITNL